MALGAIDWLVTVASLIGVFVASCATTAAKRRNASADGDAPTSFFLAGRSMKWWVAAASIFASNIGTEHFVGQAGLAATSGIAVSLYEWGAVYLLVLLGWMFAPVYLKLELNTIPEYLERRFDRRCRLWFVMLTMATYVVSKIGSSLFSGAVVLDVLADMNIWASTSLILAATAAYTTVGGLTAVMYADVAQACIFVVGGMIGAFYSLDLIGGLSGMKDTLKERELDWFLHNLHPMDDKDFPWSGMTIGVGFGVALYYWCVDQEMTQRVLSSAGLDHAQLGCVTAGYLKILPMLITVLPGMVARVLYERCLASDGASFSQWCVAGAEDISDASDSNKAYPLLVLREFPNGLKGVMVASFLAAMMSSLSSVYNSASTIFTYDVYVRLFHPEGDAAPETIVLVGRATTIGLTLLSLLWLPVIQSSSKGLYLVTQNAMAHFVGPLSSLFIVALLWPRANACGAFTSLVLGSVVGIFRLVLTVVYEDYCDDFSRDVEGRTILRTTGRNWFVCMNFNHFVILLFVLCAATIVIVSYFHEAPDYDSIKDCLVQWPSWIQPLRNSLADRKATISGRESLLDGSIADNDAQPSQMQPNSVPEESDESRASKRRSQTAAVLAVALLLGMTTLIGLTH